MTFINHFTNPFQHTFGHKYKVTKPNDKSLNKTEIKTLEHQIDYYGTISKTLPKGQTYIVKGEVEKGDSFIYTGQRIAYSGTPGKAGSSPEAVDNEVLPKANTQNYNLKALDNINYYSRT